jgi:hypothetical protein
LAGAAAVAAAGGHHSDDDEENESRGRELVTVPQAGEKQVRVVSPSRGGDKDGRKPIRGILKQPKPKFPEEANPIREGVAPHKDDKTKGQVPPGARWTRVNRRMVNPEALTIGKERFEIRDDFVIVLRVLSKEEIQAYATATAQLRGGLLHFLALLLDSSLLLFVFLLVASCFPACFLVRPSVRPSVRLPSSPSVFAAFRPALARRTRPARPFPPAAVPFVRPTLALSYAFGLGPSPRAALRPFVSADRLVPPP